MSTLKIIILNIIIFLLFFITCKLQNEKNKEKELLLQNLFLENQSKCDVYYLSSKPTFQELQEKKVFENCTRCHNINNKEGNLNLSDYQEIMLRVEPFSPFQSLLFIKITTGSMKDYSNDCINTAIKDWIEKGAIE